MENLKNGGIQKSKEIKGNLKDSNKESNNKELDKKNDPIKKSFKSELFTWNPNKSQRSKIRRTRDSLIRSIMRFNDNKDIESRDKKIVEFHSFYKKNYLRNDYSLESISYKNRDRDSEEFLSSFMDFIKKSKLDPSKMK